MIPSLKRRAAEPELMDDLTAGGPDLSEALRHLRRLNRIFAASGPTLYGVRQIWSAAGQPERFSILDIGAGSGDVNRRLLRWADRERIDLTITISDITEEACAEARQLFSREPRVSVVRQDLFQLPEGCADIVTATQFVHHFASEQLPGVVRQMLKASRMGIVIQDIHRHWLAWLAVWLVTRSISRNRYIRNDGPLSVAKGFRAEEWQRLRDTLPVPNLSITWRPLFRYVVTAQKPVN
ncbi:methyltransferase domain-containing protein [Paenibacillus residui]|uniref:Methyltransferase domain-containing protein n=1 Tax=Paenibacillus residui TaxID=629724 RepID=A0ABW3D659_9BACL